MNLKERVSSFIQPLSVGVQEKASKTFAKLENISGLGSLERVVRALPYGISSKPAKSVWAYFLNLGGDLLSPVIVAELDKMRPEPSTDGEVIFYCRSGSSFPVILTLKTDGTLHLKSDKIVEVETPKVVVKSDAIELGKASLEKIVNGESFKTLYNAHKHTFLGSPTEPVMPDGLMKDEHLSSVVKGAK